MSNNTLPLHIFYRGALSSCQYSCHYCPFAKRRDSKATLNKDAEQLNRFVEWIKGYNAPIRILFTPWGEALIRRNYREALIALAHLPHVEQVAIQTNLHASLDSLEQAPIGKLALWCSYHPSQTTQTAFLARCAQLQKMNIPYSVGMVAMREQFEAIKSMRHALPEANYLWLNANNDKGPNYYTAEEVKWLQSIDPWFDYSVNQRASRGAACYAGERSIAVDGEGNITRCQFLKTGLGNLYKDDLTDLLKPRACTRQMCDCYIGYAMRKDRPFVAEFGHTVMARIPIILNK